MTGILRALLLLLLLAPGAASATSVRMQTTLGDIEIELFDEIAPATVANFLEYVNDGDYDSSFIHRSAVTGDNVPFVIQGGGFFTDGTNIGSIVPGPIVPNNFGRSNLRGTIAMARGPAVDSAMSQWFFNVGDNTGLDTQNEGFTVFGEVTMGLDVVDAIAALQRWNASSLSPVFNEIPLLDGYPGSGPIVDYLVLLDRVNVIPEPSTALLLGAGLAALGARRRARD